jgi:hypothetical protein
MYNQRPLTSGAAALLLTLSFDGCTLIRGYDEQSSTGNDLIRIGVNIDVYKMFDNSRDWGPSYLLGPPDHHFGYGTRIDDSRSDLAPPIVSDASASGTMYERGALLQQRPFGVTRIWEH